MRKLRPEALSAVGVLSLVLSLHNRLSMRAFVLEWPTLHATLGVLDGVIAVNEMFRVEDGALGVGVGGHSRSKCRSSSRGC